MKNWGIVFWNEIWTILLEMAPYLMLGFFLAGLLSVLIKQNLIERWLGRRSLGSVVKASLLGVPLPLCSCGVIPVTSSLFQRGASKGATTSFLTSTPQTGVDSILATAGLMGPAFAGFRVLVALVSGIIAGALVDLFEKDSTTNTLVKESDSSVSNRTQYEKLKDIFRYGFFTLPQDIGKTLVFGIVLAGLLSALLPENWGESYLSNPWLTYLAVTLVAIPLYVCSTGSIPIAFALITSGVSPGAALVFLIAGPATNVATVTTLLKVLGKRTIAIYLVSIISISWLSGWLLDYFGGSFFSAAIVEHHHSSEQTALQVGSTLALIVIIIWAYAYPPLKSRLFPDTTSRGAITTIRVEGMTCSHCANHVSEALMKIPKVKSARADATQNMAWIEGENISFESVGKAIEEAGYEYKGISS